MNYMYFSKDEEEEHRHFVPLSHFLQQWHCVKPQYPNAGRCVPF